MSFFENLFERTQSQLERLCEERESYRQKHQNLLKKTNKSSSVLSKEQTALTDLEQKQRELTQKNPKILSSIRYFTQNFHCLRTS